MSLFISLPVLAISAILCVLVVNGVQVWEPTTADKLHVAAAQQESPKWRDAAAGETVSVRDLTPEDFERSVDSSPISLVLFHAPWSMSSQIFYPSFHDVGKAIAASEVLSSSSVGIFAVDLSVEGNQHLGKLFKIGGVPQMIIFRHGKQVTTPKENNIPRDTTGIVSHLTKLARQTAEKIVSVHDASRFVNPKTQLVAEGHNTTMKVVFAFLRNFDAQQVFALTARTVAHSPFTFIYTDNGEVFKEYGIEKDAVIIFHRSDDPDAVGEDPVRFPSDIPSKQEFGKQLTQWFAQVSMPLVGDFTAETKVGYLHKRAPMLLFFHGQPVKKSRYVEALRTVAKMWRNVTFAIVNPANNGALFRHLALEQSLSRHGFAIALMVDRTKYRYDRTVFSTDFLAEFLNRVYVEKSVEPFHLSSVAPDLPPYGSGKIVELSYNTFAQVALNSSNDVLIAFRSPRCPECNALFSVLNKLAAKYTGVQRLMVAFYDISVNDPVDGFAVKAAPTVMLATAAAKSKPIVYGGQVGFKQLDSFLSKHATVSLIRDNSSAPIPVQGKEEL